MNELAKRYANALFSLKVDDDMVKKCKEIFGENPNLLDALRNPVVKKIQKHAVIEKIFDREIVPFLNILSDHNRIELIDDICNIYHELVMLSKSEVKAELHYAFLPSDEDLEKIKQAVCKKYNLSDVELLLKEDASLIGGYILKIGDTLYDNSVKATLAGLQRDLQVR